MKKYSLDNDLTATVPGIEDSSTGPARWVDRIRSRAAESRVVDLADTTQFRRRDLPHDRPEAHAGQTRRGAVGVDDSGLAHGDWLSTAT